MLYVIATGSAILMIYHALVHMGATQGVTALALAFAFIASIIYGIVRDA